MAYSDGKIRRSSFAKAGEDRRRESAVQACAIYSSSHIKAGANLSLGCTVGGLCYVVKSGTALLGGKREVGFREIVAEDGTREGCY
jgi:hypothetical protein